MATTDVYTLSLHDALPIYQPDAAEDGAPVRRRDGDQPADAPLAAQPLDVVARDHAAQRMRDDVDLLGVLADRKSTRLNSSHVEISYAVFCLKKKNKESC